MKRSWRLLTGLIGLVSCLVMGPAHAQGYTAGDLRIERPWSQALPPNAPTVAVYLRIFNDGMGDDRLESIDTPIAGLAQMHEHVGQDGMMKMQQVGSVIVPAAAEVRFQPMGYHIMLLDLSDRSVLQAGQHFPVTLHFAKAGEVTVEVEVLDTPPAPHQAHQHP